MRTLIHQSLHDFAMSKDVLRTISRHGQRLPRLVLSGGHRRSAATRPDEPHHGLAAEIFGKNTCYNQDDRCFPIPKSICCKLIDIVDYLWVEDEDCREMPRPDADLEAISRELSNVYHWIWDLQPPRCSGCPRRCTARRTWERIRNALAFGTINPKEFEIYRTEPPNPIGRCWASGTVLGYRFNALVFPDHADQSSYELGRSRISKLEIMRPEGFRRLVNFDRGWDIRPDSEVARKGRANRLQAACKKSLSFLFAPWYKANGEALEKVFWEERE